MAEIPEMVNDERRAIFAELQGLDEDQWSAATACDLWTVRQVVAHRTALARPGSVPTAVGAV